MGVKSLSKLVAKYDRDVDATALLGETTLPLLMRQLTSSMHASGYEVLYESTLNLIADVMAVESEQYVR